MMMSSSLVLTFLFVSALANIDGQTEDVSYMSTHQKKLLRDYFHLQNYLNAEGMACLFII